MSKQKQPIVFTLGENTLTDYHLVNREELGNLDTQTMIKRIDELNMRVQFARKNYRGRYDEGHKKWMQTLARPMKTQHKLALSLDALVAVQMDRPMYRR